LTACAERMPNLIFRRGFDCGFFLKSRLCLLSFASATAGVVVFLSCFGPLVVFLLTLLRLVVSSGRGFSLAVAAVCRLVLFNSVTGLSPVTCALSAKSAGFSAGADEGRALL